MNNPKPKILITGASGYVGAKVYKYLQTAGLNVIGTYYSSPLFQELVYCDLTDPKQITDLFTQHNPDVIVHIAAKPSNSACDAAPEIAKDLNINATKSLVEEAKKHNAKFIFISSFAAINPSGLYGESKQIGEELVSTLDRYVILRPSMIVGVSPNTKNDCTFNKIIQEIEKKNGEAAYDLSWEFNVTFLSHLAEICLNLINESKFVNQIIPIATNKITSRYRLAEAILSPFNIKVSPIDKGVKRDEPAIDWGVYEKLLLPTKSYEEGINEIISELKAIYKLSIT
ncbi:MAG: hypothetical protein Fur003_1920 [Candidatus Dojkabacteria bacterium]